jgi:hypothetical protein
MAIFLLNQQGNIQSYGKLYYKVNHLHTTPV